MQIFPESIRSLWVEWEIRVLVLVSLLWQIILIILGGRRKYSTNAYINFILWGMYLSADWLATMSLGNLASNQMEDNNNNDSDTSKSKTGSREQQLLQALWAPFLLLHLGGPDTITAYSLEDNSLWKRHLLGLIVQVSGAFYIFLLSLGNNALTFIAIPVFVSGIIKYSERTLSLWAATPDRIRNSISFMPGLVEEEQIGGDDELKNLHIGYSSLSLVKVLYANKDPIVKGSGREIFLYLMDIMKALRGDVFKVIEVQLSFLFDVIYTKASIIYKPYGLVLRLISALSIVSALVAFHIIVIYNSNNTNYSRVDVFITYALFVGAVSLEIYALVSLILSDWTIRWLTKRNNSPLANSVYSAISSCRRRRMLCHEKRWSGYMGQLNLVDFCLKETQGIGTELSYKICFEFNLQRSRGQIMVDDDLKSLIYAELVNPNMILDSPLDPNKVVSERFKNLSERIPGLVGLEDYSEFIIGESIFIWHVATSICYYSNNSHAAAKDEEDDEARKKKREASKNVSDYLLYILLMRPSMLPNWVGKMASVSCTFNHAIGQFHRRGDTAVESNSEACRLLREHQPLSHMLEEWCVIGDACKVASRLEEDIGDNKWEVIWEVWMMMLIYAAFHCEWGSHAQQLPNGGEFLTHVSLLMADLGIVKSF